MKICVYGAASNKINGKYVEDCYAFGKYAASRGHDLIFGAGGEGLMGAAARGFKDGGAKIHGVIPKFFEENGYEAIFKGCDKITRTVTMAERKRTMEDECDAFVIVPGGVGTFEEFFEALTLKQLGRHKKPIAIYDKFGYYKTLDAFMEETIAAKFVNEECGKLYATFSDAKETLDYIENYSSEGVKWNILKKN